MSESWPNPCTPGTNGDGVFRIPHGRSVPPMTAWVEVKALQGADLDASVVAITPTEIVAKVVEWKYGGCGSVRVPLRWSVVECRWYAYTLDEMRGSVDATP